MSDRIVRVGCGQGFWGDDQEAPVRLVEGGPLDYLMLDYLAEVTMSIMRKLRQRDPEQGYARDFAGLMGRIFPRCVDQGIRVVSNAGGVNPAACVAAVLEAGREAGVAGRAKVAQVSGDDLVERLPALIQSGHALAHMETGEPLETVLDRVKSANAYLGAAPVVRALGMGADVVVTGRLADAALAYAPMIHEFGWGWDDVDRLAAGVLAGHVIECGAQCTGGNCLIDWWDMPDLTDVGFPIVEVQSGGDFVVTKHDGTGGRVSVGSVTEQLLYEIGDPRSYITPDVVADFTSVRLEEVGPDRVLATGVQGRPRTDSLKVSVAYSDGWKSTGTLTYAWPDAARKAKAGADILKKRLDRLGLEFDAVRVELVGWDSTQGAVSGEPPRDLPEVELRFGVRGQDRTAVERFGREIAPLVLTGPPSVTGYAGGRPRVQEVMAYWPALIDRTAVEPDVEVAIYDV